MKHAEDKNCTKFFDDNQKDELLFPYAFDGYNEAIVAFWHSDENRPFLEVAVDTLIIQEDFSIEIYNRDFEHPIVCVLEYDYWTLVEPNNGSNKIHALSTWSKDRVELEVFKAKNNILKDSMGEIYETSRDFEKSPSELLDIIKIKAYNSIRKSENIDIQYINITVEDNNNE